MKHTTRNEVSDMIDEAVSQSNDAIVKLVENTSDYLKQYVKDLLRTHILNPNQVPTVAVESPPRYRSNVELIHHAAYSDGHADALRAVRALLTNLSPNVSRTSLVTAVEKLSL